MSPAEGDDLGTRPASLVGLDHLAEIAMDHDGVDAPLAQPGGQRLAIATLRCFPPVQPTPTVTNRLPSRR